MQKLDLHDISLAQSGKKALQSKNATVEITLNKNGKAKLELPKIAVRALIDALTYISEGHEVSVRPLNEELSSQEAAQFLSVSRPYLIKLLENDEIPHRKIGRHRRVLLSDLKTYKGRIDQKRLDVLAKLVVQGQDLEMGY